MMSGEGEKRDDRQERVVGMEVYFHLGWPKVASTYFQNLVFPHLEGVTFYPKHHFESYKQLVKNPVPGKHLFSSEKDRLIAQEVKEITGVFPDARIILFVRRHDDWILSRYKYHIRKHGACRFPEFFNLEGNTGEWKREDLFFRDRIEAVEKLCNTPPLVLTYDDLKASPDLFIEKVTNYMGTSQVRRKRRRERIHTAFSDKQLIVLRRWNKFYRYRPARTDSPLLNKTHRKYREFLLHIIAFFTRFVPWFLVREKSLLTQEDREQLKKIREYYEADWKYCVEYVERKI